MKERPILFSAPLVRAILSGAKTQTRRTSKLDAINEAPDEWRYAGLDADGISHLFVHRSGSSLRIACPYGQPGDRLWVRETWAEAHPCAFADDRYSQEGRGGIPGPPPVGCRVAYRADGELPAYWYRKDPCAWPYMTADRDAADPSELEHWPKGRWGGWSPSIHMPRWASRITLEVTGVRVERLGDLSEEDARAEGVEWDPRPFTNGFLNYGEKDLPGESLEYFVTARESFASLWTSINGAESWDANVWTWAISFRRVAP